MQPARSFDGSRQDLDPLAGDGLDRQTLEHLDGSRPPSGMSHSSAQICDAAQQDPRWLDWIKACDRFDRTIAATLRDVPAPDGLSQRVLAALAEAAHQQQCPPIAEPVRPAPRRPRRWLFSAAAAVLALAVGLPAAIVLFSRAGQEASVESLLAKVLELDTQARSGPVVSLAESRPPAAYLPSSLVRLPSNAVWQRLSAPLLARPGVAYDLVGPAGQRGTLYVFERSPRFAPRLVSLPAVPASTVANTLGRTATAWGEGDRLFVLVVEGGEKQLRSLLQQAAPLA